MRLTSACCALLSFEAILVGQREIELTKTDLLSVEDWDSTQVRVCGLRLGMSRRDANLVAGKAALQLVQYGIQYRPLPCTDAHECDVADLRRPWYAEDVSLRFDESGEISTIVIEVRPPELRGAVVPRFKGRLYQFLTGLYSEDSRLDLFGREATQQQVRGRCGDKYKDTNYVYPLPWCHDYRVTGSGDA